MEDPSIGSADQAIVAPVAATTCDLDRAAIAGLTPFQGPFALGHECVARVVALGDDCAGLRVGDLVVVPWHIACGMCDLCVTGHPTRCQQTPPYAMFGLPIGGHWGGMFSELISVPWAKNNLIKIPEGVTPASAAAASDSLTDAYGAVLRGLRTRPTEPVLVIGGLTHGLYASAFAVQLGSEEVAYVDSDERRRSIASTYGAQAVSDVRELSRSKYPVVIDASAAPEGLHRALQATAPGGHCHSIGIYFEEISLPLLSMYMDDVTFSTGRPDITPHLPAVLGMLASKKIDPTLAFSETVHFDDLPQALLQLPEKPLVIFD
ncbi:alcohol dehydrogenase catalytic domain-containing protein [Streptomyces sp. NBC_00568]|nr:alcohol dehydrogenase catalytic domain-containing protein [Streptomyces sp. NBC_00568]